MDFPAILATRFSGFRNILDRPDKTSHMPTNSKTKRGAASLADRFAVNLKGERLRRKLSQESLAAKAGLSVSYISMLERGQRTPPLDTLESLAKALAVAPTSLLS
jgi:ribosome-binding protein aMBF1 (putative translation factor)